MKKFLALILALIFLITLCSCGNKNAKNNGDAQKAVATQPENSENEVNLPPEDVATKYYEALAALDYDTVFDLCIDPYAVDIAIESGKFENEAEYRAEFTKEIADEYDEMIKALGDNRTVSRFDVIETIEIPEDELKGEFRYVFSDELYPANSFQQAIVITAAITISGDADEISAESGNTPLFKIDGKWYIGTYLMGVSTQNSSDKNIGDQVAD